jgi:hypothetical protein
MVVLIKFTNAVGSGGVEIFAQRRKRVLSERTMRVKMIIAATNSVANARILCRESPPNNKSLYIRSKQYFPLPKKKL